MNIAYRRLVMHNLDDNIEECHKALSYRLGPNPADTKKHRQLMKTIDAYEKMADIQRMIVSIHGHSMAELLDNPACQALF